MGGLRSRQPKGPEEETGTRQVNGGKQEGLEWRGGKKGHEDVKAQKIPGALGCAVLALEFKIQMAVSHLPNHRGKGKMAFEGTQTYCPPQVHSCG